MRSFARLGLLGVSIGAAACGGSGMGPSDSRPRVSNIAPNSGTTLGGTAVTIVGANFTSDATVTIGGAPAGDVIVQHPAGLTAVTPQHAMGVADVVVIAGGRQATLTGGFTFVAPERVANALPVIASIDVRGSKPREPAQFADLDETVTVSATVTDAETAVSELTFAWSSDVGTFAGSGATVQWTAPHAAPTPSVVTLKLTVTERYMTTDASGLPITAEQQVLGSTSLRLHDSMTEVGDLAVQFLIDFSKQLAPTFVLRNFSDRCAGTQAEFDDVVQNQKLFVITAFNIGTPRTAVPFTGVCPFRAVFGDACAQVPSRWTSTTKSTGTSSVTAGTDQVTAMFEDDRDRWRLCASDFDGNNSAASLRFKK